MRDDEESGSSYYGLAQKFGGSVRSPMKSYVKLGKGSIRQRFKI